MSHEKLAGPPTVHSFYYVVSNLFNTAQMWTTYKAINKRTDKGEILIDIFALSDDEEDIFNDMISDGVSEVFEKFLNYTNEITDAIKLFNNYTPSGGAAAVSMVLQIPDNVGVYNENNINAVDRSIEKCLRFYVLREWLNYKELNDDAAKAEIQYQNNIRMLFNSSFELKKPSIVF